MTRRLANATFILGALLLLASAWAPYTPGMITGAVVLAAATAALTVQRRRGPQVPLNAPDRDRDEQ